uniref:Ovule protein n=1 Tax=Heterorhabditis bacteriophora TaxID=37862 RepID=A0A1I7WG29_HETBA
MKSEASTAQLYQKQMEKSNSPFPMHMCPFSTSSILLRRKLDDMKSGAKLIQPSSKICQRVSQNAFFK